MENKTKTLHLALDPTLREKLEIFSANRKSSMTKVINYGLEKLFEQEELDPKKYDALKGILDRRFSIPRVYTVNSFYVSLYMNASNYPNASAKDYWKTIVYLSEIDKTHKEVFAEIQDELKRTLGGKK